MADRGTPSWTDRFAHWGVILEAATVPVGGLLASSFFLWPCSRSGEIDSVKPSSPADGDRYSWMRRVSRIPDLSYGDEAEQRLDLHLQGAWTGEPTFFEHPSDPRPTLLFIHGGGWLVRDGSPVPLFYPFIEQGRHFVSMTYRLGPGTAPLAFDDAVCALKWIS